MPAGDLLNKGFAMPRTNTAQARREQELCQLTLNGVPLCALVKSGHWIVGPLHFFTAAGRWFNERTGHLRRLNGQSIRAIIDCECPETITQISSPDIPNASD